MRFKPAIAIMVTKGALLEMADEIAGSRGAAMSLEILKISVTPARVILD